MIEQGIKIDELIQERQLLADEKRDLAAKLAALGISGNRAYFARGTVDPAVWKQRTEWATRYAEIEARLTELKKIIAEANPDKDYFKEVVKEALGDEFIKRVIKECKRRRAGETPFKVSVRLPVPVVKTYKADLIALYETIISGRKSINKWISDNEPDINKADYLKSISALNKAIPPVSELEKQLRELKK